MNPLKALLFGLTLASCVSGVPRERGEVIASGVARVRFDVQARVDESIVLEVVYPVGEDGLVAAGGPFPIVVFVQGGLVPADRYRWMAEHFATRGYVTILPSHFAELAVFEADNARIALQTVLREAQRINALSGLIADDSPAVVMGHSLGGVVATWQWLATDRFSGVALLASYPAAKDPVQMRAGVPVLSVAGGMDGKAKIEDVRNGFAMFSEPRTLAIVDGMTHYDWTDAPNAGELASEPAATRPLAETRADALYVLDAWLDAVLRSDATAAERLQGTYPNVELVH